MSQANFEVILAGMLPTNLSQPLTPQPDELEAWMRTERARLSRHADIAKAIDYMLRSWPAFTRFLYDGRICLSR